MIRKIIATVVAGSMFFGLTLNAAASPLETHSLSNAYTQGAGAEAAPQPDFFPAVVAAVTDWVVVYTMTGEGRSQPVTLTPTAETAFD
jgi:hypothetical protein